MRNSSTIAIIAVIITVICIAFASYMAVSSSEKNTHENEWHQNQEDHHRHDMNNKNVMENHYNNRELLHDHNGCTEKPIKNR